MNNELYIGLMSGTSLDGIDAVLVNFSDKHPKIVAALSEPYSEQIKKSLLDLATKHDATIEDMMTLDVELGRLFAQQCLMLLKITNVPAENIRAIGTHGQTVRHRPDGAVPTTLQIGDPNIIVAQTNITTVADFRRRDIALGGQGAPLAPAFHDFLFRDPSENRWVVNIGGIANITFLPADLTKPVIGYDTGPGNTLMDAWSRVHLNKPFDKNGEFAASGKVIEPLLTRLLADPYFQRPIPKSTGREYFSVAWLENHLAQFKEQFSFADIQATLLELTAVTIADSICSFKSSGSVCACGGGTENKFLIQRLTQLLQSRAHALHLQLHLHTTDYLGFHPKWMEAMAWAWLARQTLRREPGNIPSVTGASRSTILGAIYPVFNT